MNTDDLLELLNRYQEHENREYAKAREYGIPLLDEYHKGVLHAIADLRLLISVEDAQDGHKAV